VGTLAWRIRADDNGFVCALEAVDLLFELDDLLLSLGQGKRRIRDPIDLNHQTVNQHIRLEEGHQCVQPLGPLDGKRFTGRKQG
jgi:hypothetical protein